MCGDAGMDSAFHDAGRRARGAASTHTLSQNSYQWTEPASTNQSAGHVQIWTAGLKRENITI